MGWIARLFGYDKNAPIPGHQDAQVTRFYLDPEPPIYVVRRLDCGHSAGRFATYSSGETACLDCHQTRKIESA